jgi:hypothetical protein
MIEPKFSPELIDVFRSSGWSENRRVDIGPIRALLQSRGIDMNAAAEAFLQQFHGLTIALPSNPLDPVLVDLPRLMNWMKPEEPPFLTGLIGEPLCPIGQSGWSYLLLSPSGQAVYLLDDWTYFEHYPNLKKALEVTFLQPNQEWPHQSIPAGLKPPSFRGPSAGT